MLTRIQQMCMTVKTLASMGISVPERTPRSIHPLGRKTAKYASGTEAPRQRDNLKQHKDNRHTYPGGKNLRRSLARLSARQTEFNSMRDPSAYSKPGSMTR